MEWVGRRKPSLDTRVRSGAELVRMEREEERRPAWLAATIVLKQIEKSESEILWQNNQMKLSELWALPYFKTHCKHSVHCVNFVVAIELLLLDKNQVHLRMHSAQWVVQRDGFNGDIQSRQEKAFLVTVFFQPHSLNILSTQYKLHILKTESLFYCSQCSYMYRLGPLEMKWIRRKVFLNSADMTPKKNFQAD